jgi:tetratricopeptide (TPR) repeat protein
MKRILAVSVAVLAVASLLRAEDVSVRSQEKPLKGKISSESAKGIVLDGKTIPPEEIVDVVYDAADELKFGAYAGARNEEKNSLDPTKEAKRKDHIEAALKKYQEAYDHKSADKMLKRHMKYKIAVLKTRLAQETGGPLDKAVEALKEFKDSYPASWQVLPALQTLGTIYVGRGEFKEAAALYDELTTYDISDDARVDAQIQAASYSIRAKNAESALKKLTDLMAKLPKGSRQALRAQIAVAECWAATGKADEAIGALRGIVASSTDKGIKAAGYNALGESLMGKEQYKEARWEFLWVDVVYNQDRNEHARALWSLAKIFDNLGEGDRALQCRELLANDRNFAGLEYQRLAQATLGEKKGKTK